MTRCDLGRARSGSMAVLAALMVTMGATQLQAAQTKPEYPIRKPDAAASDQTPEKKPTKPVKLPESSTTPDKPQPDQSWTQEVGKKSVEIGTQPARDVGVMKRQVPPILVRAQEDPYSLKGLKSCKQLSAEITDLNTVLGADYTVGNQVKENKAGKLAEAGGKSVVNAIIPFRGIVRELTGAAPADRRMNAAVDAGLARRGFLRGIHAKRGCKTKF